MLRHPDPSAGEPGDGGQASRPPPGHLRQRPFLGRALVAGGGIAATAGMALVLAVMPLVEEDAAGYVARLPRFLQAVVEAIPAGTPLLVLLAPGAAVFLAGYYLVRHGRRHLAAAVEASAPHAVGGAILYLRPFAADESPLRLPNPLGAAFMSPFDRRARARLAIVAHGVTRYEELLAYAFRRVARFVAIGDPRERLPRLGAARVYSGGGSPAADGEAWQAEVARQIAGARLVALHVGSSGGLRWEVERVVASADPERVVLCVNPAGKLKGRLRMSDRAFRRGVREAWSRFREACGPAFPRGLPEDVGDARFVRFEADWTAVPVAPPRRKILWFVPGKNPDTSRRTVESALAWLGWVLVPEPLARRLARRLVAVASVVLGLALLAAVAAAVLGVLQ